MAVTAPAVPATGVAVANPTGQNVDVTVTGGTVTGILVTYGTNPAPVVTTPAIPASTVAVTNPYPFPVAVAVVGGTVTVVAVNGVTQFTGTGVTAVVPVGGTVAVTYSVIPTSWAWSPLVAGIAGTVASPASVPLPPNCSVIPIFSSAPTWAWTNPLDASYTPGFQYPQNTISAAAYNQYTSLPYAQHATLAQSGLATGVSN